MIPDIDTDPFAGNDLMVLETPLLRVSRPVAACQRCRAAKIKCDGKLPACTACEKSNRASECSSTNDQFARGKERSYVATLESKVEKLEKKIADARARRKSSTTLMHDFENATPRRTSVETVKGVKSITKRAARRKEAFDIDELVSDFGLLYVYWAGFSSVTDEFQRRQCYRQRLLWFYDRDVVCPSHTLCERKRGDAGWSDQSPPA